MRQQISPLNPQKGEVKKHLYYFMADEKCKTLNLKVAFRKSNFHFLMKSLTPNPSPIERGANRIFLLEK